MPPIRWSAGTRLEYLDAVVAKRTGVSSLFFRARGSKDLATARAWAVDDCAAEYDSKSHVLRIPRFYCL